MQRWNNAAATEAQGDERLGGALGVVENRILPEYSKAFNNLDQIPLLGYGIGMGTQVGSQRLAGGSGFQLGEGSWESSIGELGLVLGIPFLIWRVSFSFYVLRVALRSALQRKLLPLIFAGSSVLPLLSGQLGQPTGLGFIVLSAGLTLASASPARLYKQSYIQIPSVHKLSTS
jgi:hypothetical protein